MFSSQQKAKKFIIFFPEIGTDIPEATVQTTVMPDMGLILGTSISAAVVVLLIFVVLFILLLSKYKSRMRKRKKPLSNLRFAKLCSMLYQSALFLCVYEFTVFSCHILSYFNIPA